MRRAALGLIAVIAAVFALVAVPGSGVGEQLVSWISHQPPQDAARGSSTAARPDGGPLAPAGAPLRVAIGAMITPERTVHWYEGLFDYVARAEGRPLRIVQRRTYEEVNGLLLRGEVDLAWLCTGAAWQIADRLEPFVAVVPRVRGETVYYSYLVVHAGSDIRDLDDLAGRTVALVDSLSLTGRRVAWDLLERAGRDPDRFLGRWYYTHGHDYSIRAVARGLADAAFVDSLVYEDLLVRDADEVRGLEVAARYGPFPIPPIVLAPSVDRETREHLVRVLTGLHEDPAAEKLLHELGVERFERADPRQYRQ